MRNITIMVVFVLIALLMVGCMKLETRQEVEILHEDAIIENVIYVPSENGARIEPSFGGIGPFGIGPHGTGIRKGGVQVTTDVTTPEEFTVVFRGQHTNLTVHDKGIYEKFKDAKGTLVVMSYQKVYAAKYEIKDSGEKRLMKRWLMGHKFLDATPK